MDSNIWFWLNFSNNFIWIVLLFLVSFLLNGGILIRIILIVFSIYGFNQQEKWKRYFKRKKQEKDKEV